MVNSDHRSRFEERPEIVETAILTEPRRSAARWAVYGTSAESRPCSRPARTAAVRVETPSLA